MKKVLMTLIVALAFSGSVFAQESYWGEIDNSLEMFGAHVGFLQVDGEFITSSSANWEDYEIGAFVNDQLRGFAFLNDEYSEYGCPLPIFELSVWYTAVNEPVTFKLYDHANDIEYTIGQSNYTILTGSDTPSESYEHYEIYDHFLIDFELEEYLVDALVISFTTPSSGIEKEIVPYTGESDHWYLIASPVGDVNPTGVANMLENTYDLYYFDQAAEDGLEWINRKANATEINDFDLEAGKGYLYANSGDGGNETVTLTFPGEANTEDVTVTLVMADGAVWCGWNLIGNPFNVNYEMDRDFLVMNEDGTEFITPDVAEREYLNPMEGAFVFADEDGEEFVFTMPDPNAGGGSGGGMSGGGEFSINIGHGHGQGHGVIDRAIVRFGEGRTLPKLQLNPNHTKVYIPQEGTDYTVVRASEMGEMPVNFKAEKGGTYTLSINSRNVNFAYLHLIDNMTGADVDLLANPAYTFDARTTDYASRFKLVFATGNSNDENFAYFNNGNLIVSNDGEATLQVIDVMGRILSSETVSGTCSKHINAAKGVYMIRLVNGNDVKVQKIVVE